MIDIGELTKRFKEIGKEKEKKEKENKLSEKYLKRAKEYFK